jgi:hypothetical protein
MTSFSDSLLTVMMAQQEIQIKGDHSSGLGRQGNGYDFCTQVSLRLTAQMVLLLLHVSAENHSHILVSEDMYSALYRLSNIEGKMFVHSSVVHKDSVLLKLNYTYKTNEILNLHKW